jgi:uncharacterized protein
VTWDAPQVGMLPDGARLHLHHGPIDLIVWADEAARNAAYGRAAARFRTILGELVAELSLLRAAAPVHPEGAAARRMAGAVNPLARRFITPMAAVAGAVADEVLAAMTVVPGLCKAWVNNGGDIAVHLTPGQTFTAAMPGGALTIRHSDPSRGIATSGWRGRSQSLGIADAVSVLAVTGAQADAAATLIANAVDLPAHPAIARRPATEIKADSDLGQRLVTVGVGPLTAREVAGALDAGLTLADDFVQRGLIHAAFLTLNATHRTTAPEAVDA